MFRILCYLCHDDFNYNSGYGPRPDHNAAPLVESTITTRIKIYWVEHDLGQELRPDSAVGTVPSREPIRWVAAQLLMTMRRHVQVYVISARGYRHVHTSQQDTADAPAVPPTCDTHFRGRDPGRQGFRRDSKSLPQFLKFTRTETASTFLPVVSCPSPEL